jgi:hypothetical protein
MNGQQISLKTVDELRIDASGQPQRFFIPAYQRGYRWSPLQVTQLLEDIREFVRRPRPEPDEFYCLQPLVIKTRSDDTFEVVDGQQRITTILLILLHFNERLTERYRLSLYSLTYDTRPSLDAFLDNPTEQSANDNVDFFYLYYAIRAIEQWFAERASEVEDIKSALLNKTKVIWFQLADHDKPVDAFTRLNVGKIPLTNDELIRALFLRQIGSDEDEAKNAQLRIAYEWDQLEKALQSDAFWYFLSNEPGGAQNRISFLFDLVARADGLPPGVGGDAYGIFYAFNERFKTTGTTPENEWRRIKQTYLMLEEWFEDRVLYHMVGFLVNEAMSINEIRQLSADCTKMAFEQRLRREISKRAIGADLPNPLDEVAIREHVANRLEGSTYTSGPQRVKSLLLLFNLATLLQNNRSNLRFQFDSFKSEQWDIEHIRSVADDKPERHRDRQAWFRNCRGYLSTQDAGRELCAEIDAFLNLSQVEASNDIFDPLYQNVLVYFHEDSQQVVEHGIGNLALLDDSTNRSYKNAVFAIKRQRLLALDQGGIFVPLCTRNVFLKCYSPRADNLMFWSEADQDDYEAAINSVLVNFFCGRIEGI